MLDAPYSHGSLLWKNRRLIEFFSLDSNGLARLRSEFYACEASSVNDEKAVSVSLAISSADQTFYRILPHSLRIRVHSPKASWKKPFQMQTGEVDECPTP